MPSEPTASEPLCTSEMPGSLRLTLLAGSSIVTCQVESLPVMGSGRTGRIGEMIIRYARLEDALRIATIHVESWRAAYQGIVPDEFLRALSVEQRHRALQQLLAAGQSSTWIAEDGDTALGWISAAGSRDDGASQATGEIWAVYVAPNHWSKGVGRALCATAEDDLRRQGFTDVTLWVLKDNDRALRFYAADGFSRDSHEERTIERGGKALSEVRMRKQLAAH